MPLDYQADDERQAPYRRRVAPVEVPFVWVLRRHHRLTLQQAHAVVNIDRERVRAVCACGLELERHEITDVPGGGCQVCPLCVNATPTSAESHS
ncbi:hypothetical protein HUO13_17295 [Saccharopolyspora erythraea]|uniref:hypothetical protein n=1 Tax=Saccharopolyspora erythraea TaxID=1836 RepID=UPI001BABDCC7|nr:hypothetical protein [Saccharopolyspora erythraea]QUH02321.1 hypothetical protein HUO13_17295 [Saccharopolyspora erythraea]